jgi:catechol 2,3-dioxygenase-like lactoylglutathione lyase family enzyme
MINLHHVHLMASDIDATIEFWCRGFGAEVVYDEVFAGARNVFLRAGTGRIHLYDQPPKHLGQGTVHHVGVQTDELGAVVERLAGMGVSVTDIRHEPTASYAMAQGPDRLLIEIFEPEPSAIPPHLREYFGLPGAGAEPDSPPRR